MEKWCSSRWVVVAVGVPVLFTILCFSPCKISLYCGVRSVIGNSVRIAYQLHVSCSSPPRQTTDLLTPQPPSFPSYPSQIDGSTVCRFEQYPLVDGASLVRPYWPALADRLGRGTRCQEWRDDRPFRSRIKRTMHSESRKSGKFSRIVKVEHHHVYVDLGDGAHPREAAEAEDAKLQDASAATPASTSESGSDEADEAAVTSSWWSSVRMASASSGDAQNALLASNHVLHESGSFKLLDFKADRDQANACLDALNAFQAKRAASPKVADFDPRAAAQPLFHRDESTVLKFTCALIAVILVYAFNAMGRAA